MCGRYSARQRPPGFEGEWEARFNVAPSQRMPVRTGEGYLPAVWGFLPHWAKDDARKPINARGETVAEKPYFRAAFRHTRCLVPADGWYEWQKTEGAKVPHFIHRTDDAPFFFAGLYTPAAGERDPTYTILTTDASPDLAPIHHRMPLALEPEEAEIWVDDGASRGNLQNLIRLAASGRFEAYPVSTYVNRPANEGPECVAPDPSVGPGR